MSEKEVKGNAISFDIDEVKELPSRTYVKKSKYDVIIDGFLERNIPFAMIGAVGFEPGYLAAQLGKRIAARKLGNVSSHIVNNQCYLSREMSAVPKKTKKKE